MIERSKGLFFCLVVFVICITSVVDAQTAPLPAEAASKKNQAGEKASSETRKPSDQPKQEGQPKAKPLKQAQPKQKGQSKTESPKQVQPSQEGQPKAVQSKQVRSKTEPLKQAAPPQEKADTAAQQKSDARPTSEQIKDPPWVVSASQPNAEGAVKQNTPVVLQNQKAPKVDTAPPSDYEREAADADFGAGLEIDTIWNTDPGFDLFSEDDVSTQVGVWFSYDLLRITEKLVLAGEVGLGIYGVEHEPQDNLELIWSMNRVKAYLAANLRFRLFSWMLPHLKLAVGASFGTIEFQLNNQHPRRSESEDAVSPLGTIGAGVTFQTPERMFETGSGEFASLSLGLLIEAGYTVASSASLSLTKSRDADPIENRTAALGELDLSGPYIRTSVLARF